MFIYTFCLKCSNHTAVLKPSAKSQSNLTNKRTKEKKHKCPNFRLCWPAEFMNKVWTMSLASPVKLCCGMWLVTPSEGMQRPHERCRLKNMESIHSNWLSRTIIYRFCFETNDKTSKVLSVWTVLSFLIISINVHCTQQREIDWLATSSSYGLKRQRRL